MLKIFNHSETIDKFQASKEVAKVEAREILRKKSGQETVKANDPWWRERVNWKEAAKNSKIYRKDYERTLPETLSANSQNVMWKRAKQLKDEFLIGMLSREELHPVKSFMQDGTTKCVVDEERMRLNNSVSRETNWLARNQARIKEFKNLMRHLNPNDPNAGDIERFRPKLKGMR